MYARGLGILVVIAAIVAVLLFHDLLRGSPDSEPAVVCYAALDEEFSRPLLERFREETGIRVDMVFDAESTKTVGLVNRIRNEAADPACDVFWNNEIVNTIRLKGEGLLAEYRPDAAAAFPSAFRDPDGTWTGFAARARVLLVNTELVPEEERPERLVDLRQEKWRGKIGIARPLAGSTATWFTVLYTKHQSAGTARDAAPSPSEQAAREQYPALLDLVREFDLQILDGNKATAQAVAAGQLAMAFTDTDDAIIEKESGRPVEILYLDREPGQAGTLFFPNTLCIIRNGPHPENARKLVEFLLSPEVETALAQSRSAQIPINPELANLELRVATPSEVAPMSADWDAVAAQWTDAMETAADVFP